MKYIEGFSENNQGTTVELTRREILALLAKLDNAPNRRTILSPCGRIVVRAVEDREHHIPAVTH